MYDQPTPTPPGAADPDEPGPRYQWIPLDWIPLNDGAATIDTNPDTDAYPDPWQSIGNDYAHGGKGIRGP